MDAQGSICATHNKKRGARNLQPHPEAPGQFICFEHDPCKVAGDGSYGAASKTTGPRDRYSPMGSRPSSKAGENICAVHGRRRGARNLQPHPSIPGQMVCRDDDQCKGGVSQDGLMEVTCQPCTTPMMPPGYVGYGSMPAPPFDPGMAGIGAGFPPGYGGAPAVDPAQQQMMYAQQMGQYMDPNAMQAYAGYVDPNAPAVYAAAPPAVAYPSYDQTLAAVNQSMENPSTYGGGYGVPRQSTRAPEEPGGNPASTCALHGKKRGSRYLQPHPTTPGLFVCCGDDPCKTGGMGGAGAAGGDVCAIHGKKRGARNLELNEQGQMVCLQADQCK